jgi:hypothetical protein
VAVAALLAISSVAALELSTRGQDRSTPSQVMPLVTDRGVLKNPSLSPDGANVAFTWAGENSETSNIYLQAIDGTNRRRLTFGTAADLGPLVGYPPLRIGGRLWQGLSRWLVCPANDFAPATGWRSTCRRPATRSRR